MFAVAKFSRNKLRTGLLSLVLGLPALGMSNAALAAYDFAKLEAAIETLTPQSVRTWEQKAGTGDMFAQNLIGIAYKCGMGVVQDHALSTKWFRKAAEQGEADAQFNLARIYGSEVDGVYKKGRAVPADDMEALKWYQRSAEQGHTQAQLKLGELYFEGAHGIPRNGVQAYKWIRLAATSGEPTAEKLLATYTAHLDPEQTRKGEMLAREWKNAQPR